MLETKATSFTFRALLALGALTAAYGIVAVVVAVLGARTGNSNIDDVAATVSMAMMCIVAAVVIVVCAFLARVLMRRIARSGA